MLDDSDLDDAILVSVLSDNGGCVGAIISLIFIGVMYYFVHQNHVECSEKHCDRGAPTLANHECMCVEKAK